MRFLVLLFVGLGVASACSSEPDQKLTISDQWVPTEDVGIADKDTGPPREEVASTEWEVPDFVIPFVYKGMVPNENLDKSDLYIVDSRGRNPMAPEVQKPLALTTFSIDPDACQLILARKPDGTPLTKAPCSCNLGCVVDRTLTWILVTVEKPGQTGFAFQIGKFSADLEVAMVKGTYFKNIVDTQFAGDFLYFSQVKYCDDPGCQFIVYRYDLTYIDQPDSLFLIPPDDDPDYQDGQHITDGHFVASADGSTLAFNSPTIRSFRLYVWREGVLEEVDYECPGGFQDDHCTGTGSDFSDLDPMALSGDGKKLAYFAKLKDKLQLRMYDTDFGNHDKLVLMNTPGKDYASDSCAQISMSDWKFNDVEQPQFTSDGHNLLFVASSNCDPKTKPFTDVLAMPTSKMKFGVFEQSTFTNLTRNQRTDGVLNTVIGHFHLSPDEQAIAFLATPVYGADMETRLSERSANVKQSSEVYVASVLAGKHKKQITYNAKYKAIWLTTVPPIQ